MVWSSARRILRTRSSCTAWEASATRVGNPHNVEMVNDVYPLNIFPPMVEIAAWARGAAEPTHEELIERLGAVALWSR